MSVAVSVNQLIQWPNGGTGTAERSGDVADAITPMQHQHGSQPAGIIFIVRLWIAFCIRRRSSRRIGAMIGIAQSGWCFVLIWRLIRAHNPC